MQRIFGLFVFAILATTFIPACGDDDSGDTDASTDTDTDTDTDSDSDAGPDGGEPFDCEDFECPADGVLHVDADASGAETGLSWADAASDLQLGLAMGGCCSPVQLWVAEGTYIPGAAQEDTFQLIAGVAMYGGFAGTETALEERDWDAHPTVLSGADDPTEDDGSSGGTFHVVTGASGATLDGFTITRGGVELGWDVPDDPPEDYQGGGMRNVGCDETLVISNCLFTENRITAGVGAGMYNESSSPTVSNCAFESNWVFFFGSDDYSARGSGGGMANINSSPAVTNCVFDGNWSNYGGGIYNEDSSPQITDCSFANNDAVRGAGLGNYGYEVSIVGEVSIADCLFDSNGTISYDTAMGPGGAIWVDSGALTISGCTFRDNVAGSGGAISFAGSTLRAADSVFEGNHNDFTTDIYSDPANAGGAISIYGESDAEIVNCAFSGNASNDLETAEEDQGGAIYADAAVTLSITNSSFSDNVAKDTGGAVYASSATIVNSVFYGNSPDELSGPDGFAHDVTYSLVQGGHAGDGNIDGDPLFVDAATGDLHLQSTSPCIDAANTSVAPEFDLEGNARVGDADMGAYEFTGEK